MRKTTTKAIALGLAVAAIGGIGLISSGASAEPQQYSAFVGVGSDATQDVLNGLAGFSAGSYFTPANAGSAYNYRQLVSFDATIPTGVSDSCITPKLGGPTFTRPNGSGAGRKALFHAASGIGTGWKGSAIGATAACVRDGSGNVLAVDISGTVDFARSSGLPSTAGTDVVAIPFGAEALTWAAYRPDGGPVITNLSSAQLAQAMATTTDLTVTDSAGNSVLILGCGIQTNSGTGDFFFKAAGSSTANEASAVQRCTGTTGQFRVQENNGDSLKARGDALYATGGTYAGQRIQVIAGFSVASYIAKTKGVGLAQGVSNMTLGSSVCATTAAPTVPVECTAANLAGGATYLAPTTGSGSSITANTSFYNSSKFGRYVYNIITADSIAGTGNNEFKAMFVGATSGICSATSTITTFGYAPMPATSAATTCGDTSRRYAWETGQS